MCWPAKWNTLLQIRLSCCGWLKSEIGLLFMALNLSTFITIYYLTLHSLAHWCQLMGMRNGNNRSAAGSEIWSNGFTGQVKVHVRMMVLVVHV